MEVKLIKLYFKMFIQGNLAILARNGFDFPTKMTELAFLCPVTGRTCRVPQ